MRGEWKRVRFSDAVLVNPPDGIEAQRESR